MKASVSTATSDAEAGRGDAAVAALRSDVTTAPDGTVALRWWADQSAIADVERRDGLYSLITNMGSRQCSADRLLGLCKDLALSERIHHFLKGPSLCGRCS